MNLPDFGFTKRDKLILLSFGLSFSFVVTTIVVFIWLKTKDIAKFTEIYPTPNPFSKLATKSATNKTSASTPSSEPVQFRRIEDNEYGFSFSYPIKIGLRKINNPAQRAFEYAKKYYKVNLLTTASGIVRPTPYLEEFSLIQKQYSIVSTNNPNTDLVSVSVMKGDYEMARESYKGFADNLNSIEQEKKTSFSEVESSAVKGFILILPVGKDLFYSVAIYPLDKQHFLQIEIQPELYTLYGKDESIANTILRSVKI